MIRPGVGHERIEARSLLPGPACAIGIDPVHGPAALGDQIPEWLFLNIGVLYEIDRVTLLGFRGGGNAHVDRCVSISVFSAAVCLLSLSISSP